MKNNPFKVLLKFVLILGGLSAQSAKAGSYGNSFITYQAHKGDQEISFSQRQMQGGKITQSPSCTSSQKASGRIFLNRNLVFQMFMAGYYHDLFTQFGKNTLVKNASRAYQIANKTAQESRPLLNDINALLANLYSSTAELRPKLSANFQSEVQRMISDRNYSSDEKVLFSGMVTSLRKVLEENVQFYMGLYMTGRICDIPYEKYYGLRLYSQGAYLLFGRESYIDPTYHQSLRAIQFLMLSLLPHMSPFQGTVYIGTSIDQSEWSTLKAGEVFDYASFMSGSANEGFVKFIKNAVLVVKSNKTGRLISSLSTFPYEGEVIWDQPKFKVLKATVDNENRLWLEVEEI